MTAVTTTHRELVDAIVALERWVEGEAAASPLDLLDALLNGMTTHFAEEEAPDGLYEKLARVPHAVAYIPRLQQDHVELTRFGGIVRDRMQRAPQERETREFVGAFLKDLADHERREEKLIASAMD